MLCVWSVFRMQCMNFCKDPLASSQHRGKFCNVIHVSGVHHQRRNNVAHEVGRGREKLRLCQWKIRKMQRMDKMTLFRTCGFLILSNPVLEWSLQGSNCLCAFTMVCRLRTVLAQFILDHGFWFHMYRVICKSLRDFRTRLHNNQDRHGRKEHINR